MLNSMSTIDCSLSNCFSKSVSLCGGSVRHWALEESTLGLLLIRCKWNDTALHIDMYQMRMYTHLTKHATTHKETNMC